MLTAFVLGSTVAGGVLVLGMPLVFGSLLALRYAEPRSCDRKHPLREPPVRDLEHASEIPDLPLGPTRPLTTAKRNPALARSRLGTFAGRDQQEARMTG